MYIIKNNFARLVFATLICVLSVHISYSQIGSSCQIRTDIEPNQEEQSFQPAYISSIHDSTQEWWEPSYATFENGEFAIATLEAGQTSDILSFSGIFADIQEGSTIHGVQVNLTGASTLQENVEETIIQFYYDGEPIGTNFAGKSTIAKPWKTNFASWDYGYVFSDWGINWSADLLQDELLSIRIQLANSSDEIMEVYLDQVEVTVHYTNVYTLCSHACVVIYNDEVPGATDYLWSVPDGVKFLNIDPTHRVVNLDFSGAEFGILDVDLAIISGSDTTYCSRQMLHTPCQTADVGNYVWFDDDFDGQQDSEEEGIQGIELALYNPYGEVVATTETNAEGYYNFSDVEKGFYFVQAETEGLTSSPSNIGEDATNSDFDESLRTSVFYVADGDSLVNIDLGLFDESSISGFIWNECDGDGNFGDYDQYKGGIPIGLYKDGEKISEITTDDLGMYTFNSLRFGMYTVKIESGHDISEVNSSTNQSIENDFQVDGSVEVDLTIGEDLIDLDGAIFLRSSLTVDVFYDANSNGVIDQDEEIFDAEMISLSVDNQSIATSLIDGTTASFTDLEQMNYMLLLEIADNYSTVPSMDYQLEIIDNQLVISDFSLNCRSSNVLTIALGPASSDIGDYVWYDLNSNGLQDDNEGGIEGITARLFDSNNEIVQTTVTDNEGAYHFYEVPEGEYRIVFEYFNSERELTLFQIDPDIGSQGYITDDRIVVGPFTTVAGTDLENLDVGFSDKRSIIGDYTWIDENRNGVQDVDELPLSGVTVKLFNTDDELLQTTESDAKGFYELEAIPGTYYLEFSHEEFQEFTINDASVDSKLNSDVSALQDGRTDIFTVVGGEDRIDIDAGFTPRNGRIGDLVFLDFNMDGLRNNDEVGLKNFTVELFTQDGILVKSTTTEEGGFYSIEAASGSYYLRFSKDGFDEASEYNPTNPDINSDITGAYGFGTTDLFTLEAYETIDNLDAGFHTVNTIIGDYVWNDYNENGLQDNTELGHANMTVNLIKINGGIVGSTKTGNGLNYDRGYYEFIVNEPGEYYLQFILLDNSFHFTEPFVMDDNMDSNVSADNGFGTSETFTLEVGEDRVDIDAGVIGTNSIIGDYVWLDTNNNGLQDVGEQGVNGMNIFLYDEFFNFIDVTVTTFHQETGQNGYYEFPEIEEGNYVLVFDSSMDFTDAKVGSNPDIDSDVTSEFVTGSTGVIALDPETQIFNVDAGLKNTASAPSASIGNMVWEDLNKNGIYETSESGRSNVYIELLDENNQLLNFTETDEDGYYSFQNLSAGVYKIYCEIPEDYNATFANNSFDDETDSDVHETGFSGYITVSENQTITNVDIGIVPETGIISGFTWIDTNDDGILNNDELYKKDVIVELYDYQDEIIRKVISDEHGAFTFAAVDVGNYYLKFVADQPFVTSELTLPNSDNMISGFNGEGTTDIFQLTEFTSSPLVIYAALRLDMTEALEGIQLSAEKLQDGSNQLDWTSTSSDWSNYYVIERKSFDNEWEEIGKVIVDESYDLAFEDVQARFTNNNLAYRIKQVNMDGLEITSNIVWLNSQHERLLTVSPNPAFLETTIEFDLLNSSMVNLTIVGIDGRLMKNVISDSRMEEGTHKTNVNMMEIPSGVYLVRLRTGEQSVCRKLVVKGN